MILILNKNVNYAGLNSVALVYYTDEPGRRLLYRARIIAIEGVKIKVRYD